MKYFRKLEGEHVYLSPMNIDDAETFVKWLNNPEINLLCCNQKIKSDNFKFSSTSRMALFITLP